ncbi:hypothetical protein [Mycoplasma hafezii]|uniref:hypothetical protein n=1 Tax=Mycoplasma hafezii TaxID=525886 RepID=UPI003CE7C776
MSITNVNINPSFIKENDEIIIKENLYHKEFLSYLNLIKNTSKNLLSEIFEINLKTESEKEKLIKHISIIFNINPDLILKQKNTDRSARPEEVNKLIDFNFQVNRIWDKIYEIYKKPNDNFSEYSRKKQLESDLFIISSILFIFAGKPSVNFLKPVFNSIDVTNFFEKFVSPFVDDAIKKAISKDITDSSSTNLLKYLEKNLKGYGCLFWKEINSVFSDDDISEEFLIKLKDEVEKTLIHWISKHMSHTFSEGYRQPKKDQILVDWNYFYHLELLGINKNCEPIAELMLKINELSLPFNKKITPLEKEGEISKLKYITNQYVQLVENPSEKGLNFMNFYVKIVENYNYWIHACFQSQSAEFTNLFSEIEKQYINFRALDGLIYIKYTLKTLYKDSEYNQMHLKTINKLIKALVMCMIDIKVRDNIFTSETHKELLKFISSRGY